MATRFLFNEALWEELAVRIPKAKAAAAVAYLGTGASSLLPLKKGDRLVVDMSLRAVRSGTTDPREVQKLLRRGVEVFSRGSLHAKFFIIGKHLLAGSSNISKHAQNVLDEAAIVTDDPAAVRRASITFEQLCSEPVRKDYLQKCLDEYRPPKFVPGPAGPRTKKPKIVAAKLWLVGGLHYRDLPEAEDDSVQRVVKKTKKKLLDFERSEVDYSHYPKPLRFFKQLREGDWLVVCVSDGSGFDVYAPARFLGVEKYRRAGGKQRYLLLYETPTDADSVRWSVFRKHVPGGVLPSQAKKPRTVPIPSDAEADTILRLWDTRGRFKGRKS